MKLIPNEILLVKGGLGRFHRVTAIFFGLDAVNQANTYMASAPGEAVLAVAPGEGVLAAFAGIVFIAACDDLGLSLPVHSSQES
jgi:hypothetical protein